MSGGYRGALLHYIRMENEVSGGNGAYAVVRFNTKILCGKSSALTSLMPKELFFPQERKLIGTA